MKIIRYILYDCSGSKRVPIYMEEEITLEQLYQRKEEILNDPCNYEELNGRIELTSDIQVEFIKIHNMINAIKKEEMLSGRRNDKK